MVLDIWTACAGKFEPVALNALLLRMVESQEQVATSRLVATLERQSVLEDLLETAKPPMPPGTAGLSYLLATPFRYPPLRHGSRFGTRDEPSLFYGSRGLPALLAEVAYYRFVFWEGMSRSPPAPLRTQHTLFRARYRTQTGLRLQDPPFAAYRATLCDRAHYEATQRLGGEMRAAGIEAFEYESARDPGSGINVALFTPHAFASRRPQRREAWLCETSAALVRFSGREEGEVYAFARELFLVDGILPQPAA
ncbi:MAG: RES family NAD+ phosphorylase [Gammaproteobacteria bacterium]